MDISVAFELVYNHYLLDWRSEELTCVVVSEALRAPPPLELIVALNLCLLRCKTMWGLSDLSPSYLFLCFPSLALSFFCFGYWLIKVDILAHIPLEHVSGAAWDQRAARACN